MAALSAGAPPPPALRYGFRSFDRQWLLLDNRLIDRLRPELFACDGPEQVYLTSVFSRQLGAGPVANLSAYLPDNDNLMGTGRSMPLFLSNGTPNVNPAVLAALGFAASGEELFCYVYGLLSGVAYQATFAEELLTPGPRLPISTDESTFKAVAAAGREMISLHTYGERMGSGKAHATGARATQNLPSGVYPETYKHDAERGLLWLGTAADVKTAGLDKCGHPTNGGERCLLIKNVPAEVFEFALSGFKPLASWLGYRMLEAKGKKSSPLDEMRPAAWTTEMSRELLELIWLLELTLQKQPELTALLQRVMEGPLLEDVPNLEEEAEKLRKLAKQSESAKDGLEM